MPHKKYDCNLPTARPPRKWRRGADEDCLRRPTPGRELSTFIGQIITFELERGQPRQAIIMIAGGHDARTS